MAHAEVQIHRGSSLVERALTVLAADLSSAVTHRGHASLALSGGSGPIPLYERLAACGLSWDRIDVWAVDERVVSLRDEHSNWLMITRTLLDPAGVPLERRHAVPVGAAVGLAGPEKAAARYEEDLRRLLGGEPRFDACVLGIGPDGHTASLFPHSPQLYAPGLATSGPAGLEPFVPRVTLTFRAINCSHLCLFYVTGESKSEAVATALARAGQVHDTPARGVHPEHGRLMWLLDAAAGGKLAS